MRVIITGEKSKIGLSFEKYIIDRFIERKPNVFLEKVSLRQNEWKEASWESYDAVLHVAGYAKSDNRDISLEEQRKYYDVNVKLTKQVVEKAKKEGVEYFIYLSTMMVYSNSTPFWVQRPIGWKTIPNPKSHYGKSKLEAEEIVRNAEAENFKVLIIREPIVYGEGLDGEIPKWLKLSSMLPIFPNVSTYRSSIYIWNLCELLRLCLVQRRSGLICPRNREQYTISEMIKLMRLLQGKGTILVPGCSWLLKLFGHFTPLIDDLLGNMYYDDEMVEYDDLPYNIYSTEESYKRMLECR